MSINLFKKFRSPNTVKQIYFYLYREINKEIARKQHQIIKQSTWHCPLKWRSAQSRAPCSVVWRFLNLSPQKTRVKDGFHMFKCRKQDVYIKQDICSWKQSFVCNNNIIYYDIRTLYRILQENKYRGRSKIKKKRQEIIVALMNM